MKTVKVLKYAVVIPARNEEKHLEKTLSALKKQTVQPSQIIVVDDGSKDTTAHIATQYADVVIRKSDRGYYVVDLPALAEVINEGLKHVKNSVKYVLICGADHLLPEDYAERVLRRMKDNPKLVISSGRIKGEPHFDLHPRGSGRIVDVCFWNEVGSLRYPISWGYEDWLCFVARQLGYEVIAFYDIVSQVQRRTKLGTAAGKRMYALGYDWKYALGRCLLTFLKSPKAGWSMFWGWTLHKNVERLDIADWVNNMQKNMFWKRVKAIIKRGGRK